ncbi:MAG: hypothetical protein ABIJ81_03400 [Patescibacteria group bacterium]
MFDEITKESAKRGVEDIFSETEPSPTIPTGTANQPPMVPPTPTTPPPPVSLTGQSFSTKPEMGIMPPVSDDGSKKKWLIIGLVIIGLTAIALIGYWLLTRTVTDSSPTTNNIINTPVNEPVVQPPPPPPPPPVVNPELEDNDGDRLNTSEELNFGTDPNNPDSDSDGLFDGEEVMIYKTNPLNSDTDADGFMDGEEVSNGYDPNGSGRLLELPNGELNFQEVDSLLKQIDQGTT